MDNILTTFFGPALNILVFYGSSTPFPQFCKLSLRLAREAGDEEAVGCIFPWSAPDHTFRIICEKHQTTATN